MGIDPNLVQEIVKYILMYMYVRICNVNIVYAIRVKF